MHNLITIEINEQMEQTVSTRELHEELGIGKDFTNWFKQQAERLKLKEGIDFTPFWAESTGGRPSVDYRVNLDTAKHLCMMSGGEKAFEIRDYFIQTEKAWNDPELVMARSLQYANRKLIGQAEEIKALENRIEKDKPMVLFAQAVESAVESIRVREMAKLLNKNGVDIGEKRLYQWLRDNGFVQKTANYPTQRAVDLGVLELKEGIRFGANQSTHPTFTTKVTGKGQIYFINKFKTAEAN